MIHAVSKAEFRKVCHYKVGEGFQIDRRISKVAADLRRL